MQPAEPDRAQQRGAEQEGQQGQRRENEQALRARTRTRAPAAARTALVTEPLGVGTVGLVAAFLGLLPGTGLGVACERSRGFGS